MKRYINEAILITVFFILVILNKTGIPYTETAITVSLPFIFGFLIYFSIKNGNFKDNKLLAIMELIYKVYFVTALYFVLKDFPGKDVIFGVSLCFALLFIIYNLFRYKENSKIICAIVYVKLFGLMYLSLFN